MSKLARQRCITRDEGLKALLPEELEPLLAQLDGWELVTDRNIIVREFRFDDFYQTMAFVNAVAWIANQQDHHPDLDVGYNRCRILYATHAVNGLSINDFICAARIDALSR
jgi:4a-hydroxytetrahydrobiopterin dehydratase